jgi:hypothetical protein
VQVPPEYADPLPTLRYLAPPEVTVEPVTVVAAQTMEVKAEL